MLSITSPEEMASKLAGQLQRLRLNSAWSRAELAERSGVTAASIKRFESTGNISLKRLLSLCFVLGVMDQFDHIMTPPKPKSMAELKSGFKKRQRGRRRRK